MYAALDQSVAQVGRKMAYSHNDAFIPVLLEFMRFQQNEEALLTLASFMVRIRDKNTRRRIHHRTGRTRQLGLVAEMAGAAPGGHSAGRV